MRTLLGPGDASDLVVTDGQRKPWDTLPGRLLTKIRETDRLQNRGKAARQIRPNKLGTARNSAGFSRIYNPGGPDRPLNRFNDLLQGDLSG